LELLLTISIIGILLTIITIGFSGSQAESRDAKRQADLRTVEAALALHKQKYGNYPQGCNTAGSWSGQSGTSHACVGNSEYIVGLAPEFIPELPRDPRAVSGDQGYAYLVNAEGTVYKFMARNSVESDDLSYDHPFQSCPRSQSTAVVYTDTAARRDCPVPDSSGGNNDLALNAGCDIEICDRLYRDSNAYGQQRYDRFETGGGSSLMTHCNEGDPVFESSYAVWGGIADPLDQFYSPTGAHVNHIDMMLYISQERETENILCRMP